MPCQGWRRLQGAEWGLQSKPAGAGGQGKRTLEPDRRGAAVKRPSDERNGGRTGALREKGTQWSQILKGDEQQRKILVILAPSHSGEKLLLV